MADVNSRQAILSYLFLDNVVIDGVWIGYHRISSASSNNTKADFIWSDGTSSQNEGHYGGSSKTHDNGQIWASGNLTNQGDCVQLLPRNSRDAGKMVTDHCDQQKPFICAKNGHRAPPSFTMSGGCDANEYLAMIGFAIATLFTYFSFKFVYHSMIVPKTGASPMKK